jgi:hypothetical protein
MAMPKPSPEQNALSILVGEWAGEEQILPGPFDPVGGPALGRAHNRLALDGFAVMHDYEQERRGAVNFRGHGVFRWDLRENCYLLHWFDSLGFAPSTFRGALENGTLTLTSRQEQGFTRAVYDLSQPGRYAYRQEVSPDGDKWLPFMTGEYRRQ